MKNHFSKSKYCRLWQCPKMLWIKDMPAEEQKKARHNLLKYCELDTYAMVKVWGELVRVVKGDTEDGD